MTLKQFSLFLFLLTAAGNLWAQQYNVQLSRTVVSSLVCALHSGQLCLKPVQSQTDVFPSFSSTAKTVSAFNSNSILTH